MESTKKEASVLLFQLKDPGDPENYYYKSNSCPGGQK